jgi:aspartyl-tRNA(Asn)/glutamyl-tRNA(Gln) amidotransferase subunit A
VRENLGDRWPACKDDLTFEIAFGMSLAEQLYNLEAASQVEHERTAMNEAMADVFDQVDLVITATCPDVAFDAEGPMRTVVGGVDLMETHGMGVALGNNGALTIPANTSGYPAASIPMGTLDGLPVAMQIVARHHREDLLLDLALQCERERPWPLVAPGSPR